MGNHPQILYMVYGDVCHDTATVADGRAGCGAERREVSGTRRDVASDCSSL